VLHDNDTGFEFCYVPADSVLSAPSLIATNACVTHSSTPKHTGTMASESGGRTGSSMRMRSSIFANDATSCKRGRFAAADWDDDGGVDAVAAAGDCGLEFAAAAADDDDDDAAGVFAVGAVNHAALSNASAIGAQHSRKTLYNTDLPNISQHTQTTVSACTRTSTLVLLLSTCDTPLLKENVYTMKKKIEAGVWF
jgi:hypothetical protein